MSYFVFVKSNPIPNAMEIQVKCKYTRGSFLVLVKVEPGNNGNLELGIVNWVHDGFFTAVKLSDVHPAFGCTIW